MKKQLTTIVNFILDKSGSMNSVRESTISGFNEYLQTLKNKKGNFLVTLTKFDSGLHGELRIDRPYVLTPIKEVEPLSLKTYQPDGGTPLIDAAVDTVEEVAAKVEKMEDEPAVLVVIMTDGEENMSKKHDIKCFRDLIHKLQHKGNWTFVYMGANQDAWANAEQYGMLRGNVLGYQSTERGTSNVFAAAAINTVGFADMMMENKSKGISMNTGEFFNGVKEVGEDDPLAPKS